MKANVGMSYAVAAPISTYTPGTTPTYGTGFKVCEARGMSLNWERSDDEFRGDDILLDADNGVTGGTAEFETAGIADSVRKSLLGEVENTTDEFTLTDAAAPDVGFGFIRVMRDNASGTVVEKYEAWWLWKVKFSLNSEETRTKENRIEWRVPTLSGKIMGIRSSSAATQDFKTHKTCETYDAAKSWLNTKAGISTTATTEE